VRTTKRGTKVAAFAIGLALIAAACGSDDDGDSTEGTTGDTTTEETTADTEGSEETTPSTDPAAEAAMVVTYDINPDAVWDDGSPITAADFQCTNDAVLNTPGSLSTSGYDQIISVEAGESDKQVVVTFSSTYAPWKGLFSGLLKADAFDDCNDVSTSFDNGIGFSGGPYKIDSWSDEQLVYAPNENYFGSNKAVTSKVVVVPAEDGPTALKAGTVDFIYPQFFAGLEDELADPNVTVARAAGGDYEGIYFQVLDGPFADPVYREAFSRSIDRDALFAQIYAPFAGDQSILNCGPIVPGPYCDDAFADQYDPAAAEALLTENGWTKGGDGLWVSPDGEVPEVRWMVNTGNTRRESTQNYLIPLLAEAGFKVVADNCEALPCVFQTRLPSLDYDMAMYISTAPPDPAYLNTSFTCDDIPTEENDFTGQNNSGWCNEEASAALEEADLTVDEAARADLVKSAIQAMADEFIMIPTFQFPKAGAYRTDKVGTAELVEAELPNYWAFKNFDQWEDVDGDGQIVIGAEQFPVGSCPNPITECSNSSWYVWIVSFPILPAAYVTTAEQTYVPTELLTGEATVEVL
jgi:peptide/nickel transport system substrate-binding protein